MPDQLTDSDETLRLARPSTQRSLRVAQVRPRYFAGSRRRTFRPSGRRRLCHAILWIETDMEV
jgi:hypothetical protein